MSMCAREKLTAVALMAFLAAASGGACTKKDDGRQAVERPSARSGNCAERPGCAKRRARAAGRPAGARTDLGDARRRATG